MRVLDLIWNRHTRNIVLFLLQYVPVRQRRVVCICWGGTNYNCNPRAITDLIIKKEREKKTQSFSFEICYAFVNPDAFSTLLPSEIKSVELGSLSYFYLLSSAQFVISNTRFGGGIMWPFKKKRGQFYIQTMHGGHGMKRQELEVKDILSEEYVKLLYEDASRIDLMLSDSTAWTALARTIFAYPKGEILEVGLPRNDVFFRPQEVTKMRNDVEAFVIKTKGIVQKPTELKFLVYCPTFRGGHRKDVYGFDVDRLIVVLEQRFGGVWYVLVSSHPNMRDYYREVYDFSHPRMVDVGQMDLQPILVASDVAITDYSSAGFEFALTHKPVFLLMRDKEEYERGLYYDPQDLPFPYATDDDSLCQNIEAFDDAKYQKDLEKFNREVVGLKETGHAAEAVVDWMEKKAL